MSAGGAEAMALREHFLDTGVSVLRGDATAALGYVKRRNLAKMMR